MVGKSRLNRSGAVTRPQWHNDDEAWGARRRPMRLGVAGRNYVFAWRQEQHSACPMTLILSPASDIYYISHCVVVSQS